MRNGSKRFETPDSVGWGDRGGGRERGSRAAAEEDRAVLGAHRERGALRGRRGVVSRPPPIASFSLCDL